jgi:hypothetical protein
MRDGLMTIALNSGRPKDKYCVLSFTLYYGSLHTRADVFLYFHDIINFIKKKHTTRKYQYKGKGYPDN